MVEARVVYYCDQGEVDVNSTDATDDRVRASIVRGLMLLQGQSPLDSHQYDAKFVMKRSA